MKSVTHLEIPYSGIRELPSSIAYLTGLRVLLAHYSKLQNVPDLSGSPNIEYLCLTNCTSLVKLDDSVELQRVKFDEVSSKLTLNLSECNLSESDFLVPLYCWSELRELNLSRNNFVSLSDCISKAVNLKTLYLCDCKRLREIPVLPPKLEFLNLNGCTSLEKIPKLPLTLEKLILCNCSGLSGDEVAKLENNLLNEEFDPPTRLNIIYPGNEIPKWFSYTSNYSTTSQHLPEYESDKEFRFEIPLKLQVGETLLGLALSFVYEPPTCKKWENDLITCIIIDGERRFEHYLEYSADINATHVSLALTALRGLREQEQHGDICQVVFRFYQLSPVKSCGVHCLLRNQDSGSSSSEDGDSGSSPSEDEEDEEQEQEQPSDSNVPFDIEEDEEQE
nr:disease resistance protein RPP2B-like isoform X1 [Malus domestica]